MTDENIRTVYQQDWENVRYQDNLRWSRFQTISVIEGAFLYAAYNGNLNHFEALIIVSLGSILVLIVSLLAIKDGYDAESHLERMLALETTLVDCRIKPKKLFRKIRGQHLTKFAILIINIFNLLFIINRC
jgi:hypothetical protein